MVGIGAFFSQAPLGRNISVPLPGSDILERKSERSSSLRRLPVCLDRSNGLLRKQDLRLLRLITTGSSNKLVAESLSITEDTVKGHVHRLNPTVAGVHTE
jgi:DNA-binding NarL/FixJ family response regulator